MWESPESSLAGRLRSTALHGGIVSQSRGAASTGLNRHLVAIALLALLVRAAVGLMASGRGEMEGLSLRYEGDAYAMAAGYGFVRPVLGQPAQVDLLALVAELGRRGERLSPANAPRLDPARWRPATL